jgi:hypothetical protein
MSDAGGDRAGAFRSAAYDAPGLAQIVDQIEVSLVREHHEEEFVTAVLAQVCDGGSKVEVLNCGHPPPLLLSGAGVSLSSRWTPGCHSGSPPWALPHGTCTPSR